MKDVKLVEKKPSERLIKLVDAIPDFIIMGIQVMYNNCIVYTVTDGDIGWRINDYDIEKNPLKNAYKLKEIFTKGIDCITEESFCDLLEEHLYLTAKSKMEELLPQIQEHLPNAEYKEFDKSCYIQIDNYGEMIKDALVAHERDNYKVKVGYNFNIWEDKENLIVKKPKPWWEKQAYFYKIYINDAVVPAKISSCQSDIYSHSRKKVGKNAGVTTFKTKQEAQAMCDKLNAVLKGE